MNYGEILIPIFFLTMPTVIFSVGKTKLKIKYKTVILAVFSIFIIWAIINSYVIYLDQKYEKELYQLDPNGSFMESEMTPEIQKALDNFSNDTARNMAPITGIIIGSIFTALGFSFFLAIEKGKKYYKNHLTKASSRL